MRGVESYSDYFIVRITYRMEKVKDNKKEIKKKIN